MKNNPFLFRFRTGDQQITDNSSDMDELYFSLDKNVNLTKDGEIFWSARTRRRPTSCHTSGKRLKAGYTRSGKWKPSKWRPARRDKRAGK
ncbi:MAG: hypothetical protein CFH08_00006 [Alphaproteobacteria bacterium MarineAlpha3_Bin7]|nr:MAG: hypothetical protein CFH08_00006 [Alphaproteobacteria bacterium MarineAlpha3_Bin7]|tara:strand:- start:56 stop:325 length:270 start_codon:yes stop_codon:yes gene_type:complete